MERNDDPLSWPATHLAAAIRSRELGSRELLELQLERVERDRERVNAVVTIDADGARAAADAADRRTVRRDGELGPLHGLAVTVKDAIETAGMRSTGGATELADHVPERDAPSVARLRRAGAIVYGKSNVPRWSEDVQTYNPIFGTTNNPHDPTRTAGGSSGGAAAAVASGVTPFELGTDIGGSIRIPSHFCGVCGHKPSFGIVSQRGYLGYLGGGTTDSDLNVFGPLARSVGDLEVLMDVLTSPDDELTCAWSLRLPPPRHDDLRAYRVGVWIDDPDGPLDPEVRAPLHAAAEALSGAGARVSESRPEVGLAESSEVFWPLVVGAGSPRLPDDVAAEVGGTHVAWIRHTDRAAALRARWREWFRSHDVLLCPVVPVAAFPHDLEGTLVDRRITVNGRVVSHAELLPWVGLVGVAYLPSTVVPVGRTTDGLPVGVQVVGPFLEDRTALFVAARLTELLDR